MNKLQIDFSDNQLLRACSREYNQRFENARRLRMWRHRWFKAFGRWPDMQLIGDKELDL